METKYEEGKVFKDLQSNAPMVDSEEFPGEKETDILCVVDPRNICQGIRVISPDQSILEFPKMKIFDNSDNYHLIRMINGVVEGESELKDQLPLNYGLHFLNAISFNKGWYIGQELTQRTFHTGVVRKVALPFVISDDGKLNSTDSGFLPLK